MEPQKPRPQNAPEAAPKGKKVTRGQILAKAEEVAAQVAQPASELDQAFAAFAQFNGDPEGVNPQDVQQAKERVRALLRLKEL